MTELIEHEHAAEVGDRDAVNAAPPFSQSTFRLPFGLAVTITRTRPARRRGSLLRSPVVYVAVLVILGLVMLTQPPPLSTAALVALVSGSLLLASRELQVSTPRLPGLIAAHRNKLAFLFAATSFAMMIAAALDFHVTNRQLLLGDATLKMLGGGLLLGIAVGLSHRQPAFPGIATARLDGVRRGWWVPALIGVLLLFFAGEISAPRFDMLALRTVSIHIQMIIFAGALILLAWGFSGMPRISRASLNWRANWRSALPLILVLIFAFAVRAFGLNDTIRSLMDELHFTDGVMRVSGTPFLRLLTPMSAQSPFTWLYTYNQYLTSLIFGYELEGFRFTSVIMGVITVGFTYGLARALFDDKRTALLCAFFLAAFAPFIHFSRAGIIQIADPMMGTMALMFAARGLKHNRRLDWVLAGVGLGLTQYFYEGGRLLFPALMGAWIVALFLLQRGKMRPLLGGMVLMALIGVLIALPYYYVLTGSSDTLLGRMDDSGLGGQYWANLLADGLDMNDVQRVAQQFVGTFRIFVAHRDLSAYYGGEQALVADYLIPFFLFGAFYLFWRKPSAAILIPLWILATGLGNGLLRDTLVSSRYVVVLPALAIATAAGMRYMIPFVWTRLADTLPEAQRLLARPRESWLRFALPVLIVVSFGLAQVHYYYFPHLAIFNVQIRNFKAYRDGIDVALRSAQLPPRTQVYIISRPEHDQHVPRNLLGYLTYGQPQLAPLLSVQPNRISPRYLLSLAAGQAYAFFVEADDMDTMRLLMRTFPTISPPQFSQTVQMPAHREFVLFYLDALPEMPQMPLR